MGRVTIAKPYTVKGCDLLLVKINDIDKQRRRVGVKHVIDGVEYKIVNVFHDCVAIEMVSN